MLFIFFSAGTWFIHFHEKPAGPLQVGLNFRQMHSLLLIIGAERNGYELILSVEPVCNGHVLSGHPSS